MTCDGRKREIGEDVRDVCMIEIWKEYIYYIYCVLERQDLLKNTAKLEEYSKWKDYHIDEF